METVHGRLPESAFYAITAILFSIAATSAICRTVARWRKQKRFQLDDVFLLVSFLCLVAVTAMLFQMLPTMYYLQNRFLNPSPGFTIGPPSGGPPPTAGGGPPSMSGGPPSSMSAGPPTATSGGPPDLSSLPEELSLSFQSRLGWFQKQISPYSVLSWTVIFCVKFAFLSFFRQLVRRLRPMQLYWRGVAIFTVIAYLYCVAEPFFSCPKPPSRAVECGFGSALTLMLRLQGLSIALDILTDALLVSIPIRLLWSVQIKMRQKLGLGAFLSLSICMAIVSIIRVGGQKFHGTYDFSWRFFWLEVESCIAVSVISLTAFPAVFMSNTTRRSGPRDLKATPWYSSSMGKPRNRKKISSTDDITEDTISQELPQYPSAAATRGRSGRMDSVTEDDLEEKMPLGQHAQPEGQRDPSWEKISMGGDERHLHGGRPPPRVTVNPV